MTAVPQQTGSRFTYADYLGWQDEKRWELIDGVAYDMTPAPSVPHQEALFELAAQLHAWLEGKPCKGYAAPTDVRLPDPGQSDEQTTSVVQPDLFVVCDRGKIEDRGIRGAPDFVLEIASPSTSAKDQVVKAGLYERHGVREYWVLSIPERLIVVRVLVPDGRFAPPRAVAAQGRLSVSALEGLHFDFDRVFERLTGEENVSGARL